MPVTVSLQEYLEPEALTLWQLTRNRQSSDPKNLRPERGPSFFVEMLERCFF